MLLPRDPRRALPIALLRAARLSWLGSGGSAFSNLQGWLKYPYDVVGFQTVARKKPEA